MKTLFLYPPQGDPSHPALGLPSLVAHLAEAGRQAKIVDVNLLSYEHFLSPEYVQTACERARAVLRERAGRPGLGSVDALDSTDAVCQHLPEATAMMRPGSRRPRPREYAWARDIIERALEIISASVAPTVLGFNSFRCVGARPLWAEIVASSESMTRNPYVDFFREELETVWTALSDIEFFGVSVTWFDQLVPTLTLLRELRRRLPAARICLGGALTTHLCTRGGGRAERLLQYCDYIITFEGELSLIALLDTIETGGPLTDVPNLIFAESGAVCFSGAEPVPPRRWPVPMFDSLPLERYLSPELILPLLTSRGCYWRRCSFCSHSFTYTEYRTLGGSRAAADMTTLADRHGAWHFVLMDDCVAPATLRQMVRALSAMPGRRIRWGAELRLERALEGDLGRALHDAGCRFVLFGMESGSQRVLNLMEKGTDVATMSSVVTQFGEAGIAVWLLFFLGHPGESETDAEQTLQFIVAHQPLIVAATGGGFVLTEHSPISADPSTWGVRVVDSQNADCFSLAVKFDRTSVDDAMVERLSG